MAEKLGARKNSSWKAICTAPDFCKTPVGSSTPPIPYQVIADLGQSENCAPSVRFNGDPCFVFNPSTVPTCTGDEPGTAGGVRSGTAADKVKPTGACPNVRAEGKQVVRKDDPGTMNDGNCSCIFTTQPAPGGAMGAGGEPTPQEPAITPDTPEEVQAAQEGLWGKLSGPIHFVLGTLGFVPALGAVPDVIDGLLYAVEGDRTSALASGVAAFPFGGDAVKAGTLLGKAGKRVARDAAERGLIKGLEKEGTQRLERETVERLQREARARLARERLAQAKLARERAAKEAAERKARQEAGEGTAQGAGRAEGGVRVEEKKPKGYDKCKVIEGGVPGQKYKGGRYGTIAPGGATRGQEAHHIPAAAAGGGSPLNKPAIQMDVADHRRTASWGNNPVAAAFRSRQKALMSRGKKGMLLAMVMDFSDIKSKFGSKYDSAIAQMMTWAKCKEMI
jgi:hypothetical protein